MNMLKNIFLVILVIGTAVNAAAPVGCIPFPVDHPAAPGFYPEGYVPETPEVAARREALNERGNALSYNHGAHDHGKYDSLRDLWDCVPPNCPLDQKEEIVIALEKLDKETQECHTAYIAKIFPSRREPVTLAVVQNLLQQRQEAVTKNAALQARIIRLSPHGESGFAVAAVGGCGHVGDCGRLDAGKIYGNLSSDYSLEEREEAVTILEEMERLTKDPGVDRIVPRRDDYYTPYTLESLRECLGAKKALIDQRENGGDAFGEAYKIYQKFPSEKQKLFFGVLSPYSTRGEALEPDKELFVQQVISLKKALATMKKYAWCQQEVDQKLEHIYSAQEYVDYITRVDKAFRDDPAEHDRRKQLLERVRALKDPAEKFNSLLYAMYQPEPYDPLTTPLGKLEVVIKENEVRKLRKKIHAAVDSRFNGDKEKRESIKKELSDSTKSESIRLENHQRRTAVFGAFFQKKGIAFDFMNGKYAEAEYDAAVKNYLKDKTPEEAEAFNKEVESIQDQCLLRELEREEDTIRAFAKEEEIPLPAGTQSLVQPLTQKSAQPTPPTQSWLQKNSLLLGSLTGTGIAVTALATVIAKYNQEKPVNARGEAISFRQYLVDEFRNSFWLKCAAVTAVGAVGAGIYYKYWGAAAAA